MRAQDKWRKAHPEVHAGYSAAWRKVNPLWAREYNLQSKIDCLSHYGLNGGLQCAWPGCDVVDIDVLTLDHKKDNGAEERRSAGNCRGGVQFYQQLRKRNWPVGYQTLCCNHQMKKELMRRRSL